MGDCKKCIIMALKALGATDDPGDLFIDDTQLSSLQYMDEHGALVSINATASGALKSFKRWIQSLVAQGSFTDWLSLSPQDYGLFCISAQNQIQPNVVPPPAMALSRNTETPASSKAPDPLCDWDHISNIGPRL